jgi:hypothetical protein
VIQILDRLAAHAEALAPSAHEQGVTMTLHRNSAPKIRPLPNDRYTCAILVASGRPSPYDTARIAMARNLGWVLREAAVVLIPVVLVIGGFLLLVLYLDKRDIR